MNDPAQSLRKLCRVFAWNGAAVSQLDFISQMYDDTLGIREEVDDNPPVNGHSKDILRIKDDIQFREQQSNRQLLVINLLYVLVLSLSL